MLVEHLSLDVGRRIRETRKAAGLSIPALAELSSLSPAAIQKIETNGMVPSIISLMKIARALDRSVSFLVGEHEPGLRVALVRGRDREGFYSEASHCEQEYITADLDDRILEGGIFRANPGGGSGDSLGAHPGEEIIMCLIGKVQVDVGESRYLLEPGDTLHFKSDLPHKWVNAGDSTSETLWIYTQNGIAGGQGAR